jgi:hypothetical protein
LAHHCHQADCCPANFPANFRGPAWQSFLLLLLLLLILVLLQSTPGLLLHPPRSLLQQSSHLQLKTAPPLTHPQRHMLTQLLPLLLLLLLPRAPTQQESPLQDAAPAAAA